MKLNMVLLSCRFSNFTTIGGSGLVLLIVTKRVTGAGIQVPYSYYLKYPKKWTPEITAIVQKMEQFDFTM